MLVTDLVNEGNAAQEASDAKHDSDMSVCHE
jgi:hypothetical protein